MKISELSSRSGVPVATIKFYVRERLLAAGEKSNPTQASYDESHLARLRLIRAFLEVGGLSIASVRAVLGAIDDESLSLALAFGVAAESLPTSIPVSESGSPATPGTERIDRLIAERGWHVSPENAARRVAARVLDDYAALGRHDLIESVEAYADAAELVARRDLQTVAEAGSREAMTSTVVVGTVLGDALLAGLRRMAHEDTAVRMFPVPGLTDDPRKDTST